MSATMIDAMPARRRPACRRRSQQLLDEMQREVQRRDGLRNPEAVRDADTSIAWAASQIIDWLAWEASDRNVWPALVGRLGIPVDGRAAQRERLRALHDHAMAACPAMRHLEQIASAGRVRVAHIGSDAPPGDSGQTARAGRDALAWLTGFTCVCNEP